jgi:DNA-directed RNA polymerase specialized sigma24 family protein
MDSPQAGAHAPSDERLLRDAAAGTTRAVAELFDRYAEPLLNYADRVTGVAGNAAAAVQDAFVDTVCEARGAGESATEPSRRLFRNVRAASLRVVGAGPRDAPAVEAAGAADALVVPTEDELQAALRAANLNLPVPQREVLALRELEEMTYEVIAEVMSLSPLTVAQLAWRGYGRLLSLVRGEPCDITLASWDCDTALALMRLREDAPLPDEAVAWLQHHVVDCAHCRGSNPRSIAEARATYRRWLRIKAAWGLRGPVLDRVRDVLGADPAQAATPEGQGGARRARRARRQLPAGVAVATLVVVTGVALHRMDLRGSDGRLTLERPGGSGLLGPPAAVAPLVPRAHVGADSAPARTGPLTPPRTPVLPTPRPGPIPPGPEPHPTPRPEAAPPAPRPKPIPPGPQPNPTPPGPTPQPTPPRPAPGPKPAPAPRPKPIPPPPEPPQPPPTPEPPPPEPGPAPAPASRPPSPPSPRSSGGPPGLGGDIPPGRGGAEPPGHAQGLPPGRGGSVLPPGHGGVPPGHGGAPPSA